MLFDFFGEFGAGLVAHYMLRGGCQRGRLAGVFWPGSSIFGVGSGHVVKGF